MRPLLLPDWNSTMKIDPDFETQASFARRVAALNTDRTVQGAMAQDDTSGSQP
jgi:hypothetical protein